MLATLINPIKTGLNTNITTRGQAKQHTTVINLVAHTKNINGRKYLQLLTNPDIAHLNSANTPPLRYNEKKVHT